MRSIRIFLDQAIEVNQNLTIELQPFRHLIKVLRLKVNQNFIAFNGDGFDYKLSIHTIEKKYLTAQVITQCNKTTESPLEITLYQALTKTEHMDWSLQKSTELGVTRIVPFISERTQGRLNEKQLIKKNAHWLSVIRSACEQSDRSIIPQLESIYTFDQLTAELKQTNNNFILHFSHDAIRFDQIKTNANNVHIICGAEGGFTDEEVEKIKPFAKVLTLGPRVLRTETAAISAISILQNLLGDI